MNQTAAEKMSLPDEMKAAAERSRQTNICMMCGERSGYLVAGEDWDGNIGRVCLDCRDNEEELTS